MRAIRSYLAGTGASGSLVAAAVVALLSVAAFVAFDGLPFGTSERDAILVELETSDAAGPRSAAAAIGAAAGAVAATPASPGADGSGRLLTSNRGPGDDPNDPGDPDPDPDCPDCPSVITDPPPPPGGNPVNDVLGDVDNTAGETLGIDPGLSEATRPVTDGLDRVLRDRTGRDLRGTLDGLPPLGGFLSLP